MVEQRSEEAFVSKAKGNSFERWWAEEWEGDDAFEPATEQLFKQVAESAWASAQTTPSPSGGELALRDAVERCGKCVCHFIARQGSYFPCALEVGHEGDCLAGGTCVRHGAYISIKSKHPPQCPHWPTCALAAAPPSGDAPLTKALTEDYAGEEERLSLETSTDGVTWRCLASFPRHFRYRITVGGDAQKGRENG
jgi:hypothetical protein